MATCFLRSLKRFFYVFCSLKKWFALLPARVQYIPVSRVDRVSENEAFFFFFFRQPDENHTSGKTFSYIYNLYNVYLVRSTSKVYIYI